MKTVQLKKGENSVYLDGNFEFKLSNNVMLNEDMNPIKEITFAWSVETPQDLVSTKLTNDDIFELFGEKLKNDFISFCKKNN